MEKSPSWVEIFRKDTWNDLTLWRLCFLRRGWRPACLWLNLVINWKNNNDVTICRHHVVINFFWRCFVSLIRFSYWSKFHVNIIIGSGVLTIFFYKGLARNLEIGNTPVWVLPNIWRLGWVRDTKFGTNVSNEM